MSAKTSEARIETGATQRDHGGNLSAAITQYGGPRANWIDLSTGINPAPYPLPSFSATDWTALPDSAANEALQQAARQFWSVPDGAAVLPAPGASALIALLPGLAPAAQVRIETPSYNEHAAAFAHHGWSLSAATPTAAQVAVHPNNPDGRMWREAELDAPFTIIDESFCDVCPDQSLIHMAERPGVVVLKSFGKFWGLAGMRLGFAIGDPALIQALAHLQGPWAVSGPALKTGIKALQDHNWARQTRRNLARDAMRLDQLATQRGARLVGGTDLFRLYEVDKAAAWQNRLAKAHIWSRTFPYSETYIRLGLPPTSGWDRLEAAL
ncbi:threonine-phosphate decarboxylase CobD [Pseudophaeobacter flagellatus]|uniref:threonine-phosphate decarboxylase CobD n=1 Tax=Pseudophaeobacter flagellatus TaxID=2899119 RepID=UPI001E3C47DE|nr:threonine-phosphate decarboxylase CobD [Pseudophaeobacter flagellatus]MCD9149393.1 threonine-phosphate decarboxylase CobD [Pseudophaeobacter flagellatus]